ncbi:MAG: DUF2066 domain-containing protein [Reyranellaceae bacterium]
MPPNRWFSTIAAALIVAIAACVGAHAQDFTVTDVNVDVTAPDAIQARDQGIREARRKAATLLVERMVPTEDRAKVPAANDAQLESMVRGIEFVRERTAPGRYIATLNVVFSPGPVKAWLGESGVKTTETVSRPALVIPLWKGPSGVEPLDDRNAWREAWRTLDTASSAVPVTLLRGDQLDQNAVTAEQAYVGDVSALARLTDRYRAPVIVVAIVEGDKDTGPLTVGGLRYDAQTGARSEIAKETVPGAAQLGDAAKKMHAKLDEQWRGMATIRRDSQDVLEVYVPIRALGDWVQIRQRLGAVPAVKNVQVRTLEADRADLRLEYFGTPEELQRILAQAGLTLDRDADKWRLQAR